MTSAAPARARALAPPAAAAIFHALADPTRCAVVGRLGRSPATVSELAAPFAMALPSFVKHLGVLERAGLVQSSKHGRTRTVALQPKALAAAEYWLAAQRTLWEARTDRLAALAESLHQQESPP